MFDSGSRRLETGLVVTALIAALLAPTHLAAAQTAVTCNGLEATIVGTERGDLLLGTEGADVIAGLGGNDVIRGFGGNDVICGDNGRDRLFGGRGSDILFGGKKNDIVKGDGGPDLLYGNQGRDRVYGGGGGDYLEGGSGLFDLLVGKGGTDTCVDRQPSTRTETCEELGAPRPPAGQQLDVVGVIGTDVLNFRQRPDPSSPILATAPPATEGVTPPLVVATGVGQNFGNEVWWQVTIDGTTAWANARFLGMLGVSANTFDELEAEMASLSAETIEELAEAIAATRSDGPIPVVVVVELIGVDAPSSLATIDVIGIGDDAVRGERIHLNLFNIRDIEAQEFIILGYEITDATSTAICGRGITVDDLCV